MARMGNEEFGAKAGCHYSMASRLYSGDRLPSRDLLRRIIDAFELDRAEAYLAYDQGAPAFSRYLRINVFHKNDPNYRDGDEHSHTETTPETPGNMGT